MAHVESIHEFHRRNYCGASEHLSDATGQFKLFRLAPIPQGERPRASYRRRDFYKIMLIKGGGTVYFANKKKEVKKQALTFSNPMIPYKWEDLHKMTGGAYCIFDRYFFHQFGDIEKYPLFQPASQHVLELDDEQCREVEAIYERMFKAIESNYPYKYDLLRNLVFDLIHFAMQLEPVSYNSPLGRNAPQHITGLFLDLLERHFPIDESHPRILLRTPSDFARQLHIHVNNLNRVLKQTTGKTTSQIIAERIAQEARILLIHSPWTIKEIAWALGFKEAAHFSNFFKKITGLTPLEFRKGCSPVLRNSNFKP